MLAHRTLASFAPHAIGHCHQRGPLDRRRTAFCQEHGACMPCPSHLRMARFTESSLGSIDSSWAASRLYTLPLAFLFDSLSIEFKSSPLQFTCVILSPRASSEIWSDTLIKIIKGRQKSLNTFRRPGNVISYRHESEAGETSAISRRDISLTFVAGCSVG